MGKTKKVKDPSGYTIGKQLGWTGRAIALASNFIVLGQITFYCTDMLGMDAVLVGTLLLISKLFDGVTDLAAGFIVDKTNTKWGKARPYELCIFGVTICTWLLYSCPDFGILGKSVWVFIMYTLVNSVFTTMMNATDAVYLCRAFKSQSDQIKIVSINGVGCTLGAMVVSVLFPIMIGTMGATKAGWSRMVLLLMVPFTVIGMCRFLFVKENNVNTDVTAAQKINMRDFMQSLKVNPYIFIFGIAGLLVNLVTNIGTAVNLYYYDYIVGNVNLMGLASAAGIVTLPLILFFPALMKKLTSAQIIIASLVLGVGGNILKAFAGANMPMIMTGTVVAGIAALPMSYLGSMIIIDCMDYSEWKTGKRVEGAFSAVYSFATKVGSGLASSVVGIFMGMAGYDGKLAVQSESALTMIVGLFSWIPAIICVLTIILMCFYKLDKYLPQARADLEAKKEQQV